MEEILKDIKNYENLYQVSNLGNVRSKTHIRINGKNKNRFCVSKGKLLIPGNDNNGYMIVVLSKNGKTKSYRVHRLVAEMFIPNDKKYNCIKIWESITEAEKNLKKKRAGVNISACCKLKNKTAYGFIWRYANVNSLQKD